MIASFCDIYFDKIITDITYDGDINMTLYKDDYTILLTILPYFPDDDPDQPEFDKSAPRFGRSYTDEMGNPLLEGVLAIYKDTVRINGYMCNLKDVRTKLLELFNVKDKYKELDNE